MGISVKKETMFCNFCQDTSANGLTPIYIHIINILTVCQKELLSKLGR